MKARNLILGMMAVAAMMATNAGLTSCSKDDDGGAADETTSDFVGTWMCNKYFENGKSSTKYMMYAEDGYPPTKVTLEADGTCSGSGLVINGSGSYTVKTGNGYTDGYWAIFTFTQNGKVVSTDTLKTYTNDRLTGEVRIQGHAGKTFIFTKQ